VAHRSVSNLGRNDTFDGYNRQLAPAVSSTGVIRDYDAG
jgi:hypothetical protein